MKKTLARLVDSVENSKVQKILEYVIRVSKMAPQEFFELVNEQKQSELGGIMETTAEQLISIGRQEGRQAGREEGRQEGRQAGREEGRQEGRQAGREEGRQEGIEKEKTKTLIRLLNKRFGSLSDDDMSRIDQANLEQLDIWTDAIFDASDLPEVFTKSI